MSSHFCLSVTLLNAEFHGYRDDGMPEWPPSPLRAFQALVAAAAVRWREPQFGTYAAPALEWLEGLDPPEILAPVGRTASLPYRLYVPNNAGDLVTKAWASGSTEASIATHRTEKDVRPTYLVGGDVFTGGNTVWFVWRLPADPSAEVGEFIARLSTAARSLTHLGWGIDMTASHARLLPEQEVVALFSDGRLERWSPGAAGTPLRVPQAKTAQGPKTFHSLVRRHEAFTRRMTGGKPQDVPSFTTFATICYRRNIDMDPRPLAAFEIWKPLDELADLAAGKSKFRPFDTVRWAPAVAGMVRHATGIAAHQADWPIEQINRLIHGHTPDGTAQDRGEAADGRLSYLPLPSLERRGENGIHVGMVRRVLVVGQPSAAETIRWARRALSGQELFAEKQRDPIATLSVIRETDPNVQPYLRPSKVWSTVTPVIMPGFDDRDAKKTERLLRNALRQAGFPTQLQDNAALEWRPVGFRAGLDLAVRYCVGSHHERLPRYHVRITWPVPVHGPICLGTGRYYGMGLFAAEESS